MRITSDFLWESSNFVEAHDLLVRTRHARALTWLFLEVRDAFSLWLDASNKYGFYGSLAEAALDHLAQHQPETVDARPLLEAVLHRVLQFVALSESRGNCLQTPQWSSTRTMLRAVNGESILRLVGERLNRSSRFEFCVGLRYWKCRPK